MRSFFMVQRVLPTWPWRWPWRLLCIVSIPPKVIPVGLALLVSEWVDWWCRIWILPFRWLRKKKTKMPPNNFQQVESPWNRHEPKNNPRAPVCKRTFTGSARCSKWPDHSWLRPLPLWHRRIWHPALKQIKLFESSYSTIIQLNTVVIVLYCVSLQELLSHTRFILLLQMFHPISNHCTLAS